MAGKVHVRKDPPSGTILIDDLTRRNPLSRMVVDQLLQGLEDLRQEPSVRCIIITGSGDMFSSGTDLAEVGVVDEGDSLSQAAVWQQDVQRVRDLYLSCLRHPKIIIAALPGPALGTGAGLALAADLMLATPQTVWAFPEGNRGLVAGAAIPLVAFRWGAGLASRLCVAGLPLTANQARDLGLVLDVVSPDDLWLSAHQLAETIAKTSPSSVSLAKRVLLETAGEDLESFLSTGAAAMAAARTTPSAREGIQAFLDKRSPDWFRE